MATTTLERKHDPLLVQLCPASYLQAEPLLSVSQWADTHRMLDPKTSAEPGQWHTDRTPYLREIMDSFVDQLVEEIIIQSCTQVGKTETILNCLGYVIDQDPGPTLVVLPRDEDCRGWAKKRVKPMVETSPRLLAHTTGLEDHLSGKLYTFDRMFLKFGGANSPADLASDACRYVFFDEVNKYPKFSGREADPVKLGEERTRTFWNRKIIKVSTPTLSTGYITVAYHRSDRRRYLVPCPHCGLYQPLEFSRKELREESRVFTGEVKWPEGAEPDAIKDQKLAWYECAKCKGRIEEGQKYLMLQRGLWCPHGMQVTDKGQLAGEEPRTSVRGYHLSALYSPWVSWSEIVEEFLKAKDKPNELMGFVNSVLGEPWVELTEKTKDVHIKARVLPYPMGTVPAEGLILTAGVDVQKDHFWFVIRAWGIGEESWLIRYGKVETKEELLEAVLTLSYPVMGSPEPRQVRLVCIDSGHRTNEVYELCRGARERMRPIKGYDHVLAAPYRVSMLEKDSRGKPIPGGIGLWSLDVTFYKDKLNRLIHAQPGSPSEWHVYQDIPDEYVAHLTSEQKAIVRNKETGKTTEAWQPVVEGRANHLLDCYSDDTEVLTEKGWRSFFEIAKSDRLATVNLSTDAIEYQHPLNVIVKAYSGPMIHFGGVSRSSIDLLVTPNHRMVVYPNLAKGRERGKQPQIVLAKDMTIWHRLKIRSTWEGNGCETVALPASTAFPSVEVNAIALAKFLGWYVAEGYCQENRARTQSGTRRRVVIYQNEGEKRDRLRGVLQELPWKFHETERGFVISNQQAYNLVCELGDKYTKRVPEWIKWASSGVILAFLRGAVDGDGWRQRNSEAYCTVSKGLADDVQELWIKAGYSASITMRAPKPYRIRDGYGENTVPQYHVHRKHSGAASLRDGANNPNFREVPYDGRVVCATVPNGTLIVRRNGKVHVCGNCEVYATAAADMAKVYELRPESAPQVYQPPAARSGWMARSAEKRGGWMSRR